MKFRLGTDEETEDVDITPMIDVVFLLVIFFMVTSTFIEEAKVYKIKLPRVSRETQPTTVAIDNTHSLTVTIDGKIYAKLGEGEIELRDMEEAVAKIREANEQKGTVLPVILRCDAQCEYSQYVQAKNALKLAGVDMIFEEVEMEARK